MKNIRVAIIGCGRISDLHFKAYENIPGAEVYCLCDKNISLVKEKQKEWNIEKGTDSFDQVLEDPEIDAVEILTPQKLHEDMVIKALRAGKHVAVQKPMSISLDSADRMIREAAKVNCVFKVTENYVSYPPIVIAKQMIDEGVIGNPLNLRINLIAGGKGGWEIPDTAWEWRVQELLENRGQETFDHGHHLWSTAWYLMGEFSQVSAWIDSFEDMVDSPDVIMWKYREGQRYGTCSISYCNEMYLESDYYPNDEWIDICGSRGIIRINRCTGKLVDGPVLSVYRDGKWEDREDIPSDWQLGFDGAARNFVASIMGTESPFPSGEEGRSILAVDLAIQKAANRGRPVFVEELDHLFPDIYAFGTRIKNIRSLQKHKKNILKDFRGGGKSRKQEDQAVALTMNLVNRVKENEIKGWTANIGLVLTRTDKGEDHFSILFSDDKCDIKAGECPPNADLIITVPKSVWAGILLGKKKIQTAYIQGTFKMKGDLEYTFKLKSAFGL